MIEWHIQSRAHACQVSGRQFTDGETYHTVLRDTKSGFERIDLCAQAFRESGGEILSRPGIVSHWKGTYEAPPPVPPEAIRKDDAESLLRKLIEKLTSFIIDPQRFNILKESYVRALQNFR